MPDGLDNGNCCSIAQLQLPSTWNTQPALGICWRGCQIDATQSYQAIWSPLFPGVGSQFGTPACGWYRATVGLRVGSVYRW